MCNPVQVFSIEMFYCDSEQERLRESGKNYYAEKNTYEDFNFNEVQRLFQYLSKNNHNIRVREIKAKFISQSYLSRGVWKEIISNPIMANHADFNLDIENAQKIINELLFNLEK